MGSKVKLAPGEVHLWCFVEGKFDEEALLRNARKWMSVGEQKQAKRFTHEGAQRNYLIARGASRSVLSRYTGIAPDRLLLTRNAHGRPSLEPASPVHFNLTHTDGIVALAISNQPEIGIDAERRDRQVQLLPLAESNFALAEIEDLKALTVFERPKRFFQYWTLKEAYIKARGMGLALPLKQFAFQLRDESVTIAFDPGFDDQADDWKFALLSPTKDHQLAVAVRQNAPLTIRNQEITFR